MRKSILVLLLIVTLNATAASAQTATPTPVNNYPIGYLDVANDQIIGLWAIDPDRPNSPVEVRVWVDGEFVFSGLTFHVRPDVNAAFGVMGDHGLTIRTPPPMFPCEEPRLRWFYAEAMDLETGHSVMLTNGSKASICWNNMPKPDMSVKITSSTGAPLSTFAHPWVQVQLSQNWNHYDDTFYLVREMNWFTGDGMSLDGLIRYWNLEPGNYMLSVTAEGHQASRYIFRFDGNPVNLGNVSLVPKGARVTSLGDAPIVDGREVSWSVEVDTQLVGELDVTLRARGATVTEFDDVISVQTLRITGPYKGSIGFRFKLPFAMPRRTPLVLWADVTSPGNPWENHGRSPFTFMSTPDFVIVTPVPVK